MKNLNKFNKIPSHHITFPVALPLVHFIGLIIQHSFIVTQHSLIGYATQHSFIGYVTQHSLTGHMTQHSLTMLHDLAQFNW